MSKRSVNNFIKCFKNWVHISINIAIEILILILRRNYGTNRIVISINVDFQIWIGPTYDFLTISSMCGQNWQNIFDNFSRNQLIEENLLIRGLSYDAFSPFLFPIIHFCIPFLKPLTFQLWLLTFRFSIVFWCALEKIVCLQHIKPKYTIT